MYSRVDCNAGCCNNLVYTYGMACKRIIPDYRSQRNSNVDERKLRVDVMETSENCAVSDLALRAELKSVLVM